MKKYLHFTCPTDCLELSIKEAFVGEHYFLSSLGNSMKFARDVIDDIEELIFTYDIEEICFVLSDENRLVMDALKNQDFSLLNGLEYFCDELGSTKKSVIWKDENHFLVSSYYLQEKVAEFRNALCKELLHLLPISAKIYNRNEGRFREICPSWILDCHFSLN